MKSFNLVISLLIASLAMACSMEDGADYGTPSYSDDDYEQASGGSASPGPSDPGAADPGAPPPRGTNISLGGSVLPQGAVAAAIVTYGGAFTFSFRRQLIEKWRLRAFIPNELPIDPNF